MPSTYENMQIYPNLVHGSYIEMVRQVVEIFNAQSNNTIVLASGDSWGWEQRESYIDHIETVHRVDHTDPSGALGLNRITSSELRKPTVLRGIGATSYELATWLQGRNWDAETLSAQLGAKFARDTLKDRANTAIKCLVAAMSGETDMTHDVTGSSPGQHISGKNINGTLRKLGDRRNDVAMLVMHSTTWADLIDEQIDDKLTGVSDFVIREGTPQTLNIPTLVIDSDDLLDEQSPGDDEYYVLALRPGAITVTDLMLPTWMTGVTDLADNVVEYIVRGDARYQLAPAGFSYDDSTNQNPNDAALANSANWDWEYTDVKDGPGAILNVVEV